MLGKLVALLEKLPMGTVVWAVGTNRGVWVKLVGCP